MFYKINDNFHMIKYLFNKEHKCILLMYMKLIIVLKLFFAIIIPNIYTEN